MIKSKKELPNLKIADIIKNRSVFNLSEIQEQFTSLINPGSGAAESNGNHVQTLEHIYLLKDSELLKKRIVIYMREMVKI
jgi:hypothetical protein